MKRATSTPAGLNVKKITAYLKGQAKSRNAVLTASPGSPPGLFLHPVTKSCSNLLLLFAFCSIMTVTKHEKEVSRYDYDPRLRPLDRASRRH